MFKNNFLWKFLRYIKNNFIYQTDIKEEMNKWKTKGIEQNVLKSLILQDLLYKTPKEGLIVECGVGIGWSLSIISQISSKKIYVFDSFEGFPKGTNKDAIQYDPINYWHYKHMNVDFVKDNLLANGVSLEQIEKNITFKKGFYPESFANFDSPISFLHLDVDLYNSYKECLKYFYPLLIKGGIITFDEYDQQKILNEWPGAKIAIDEFIIENNLQLLRHWTGYTYVIK